MSAVLTLLVSSSLRCRPRSSLLDVEEEKSLRRTWKLRRTAIDLELEQLRKGPLARVRFHDHPTTERPSEDDSSIVDNLDPELEPALQCKSFKSDLGYCIEQLPDVPTHLSVQHRIRAGTKAFGSGETYNPGDSLVSYKTSSYKISTRLSLTRDRP